MVGAGRVVALGCAVLACGLVALSVVRYEAARDAWRAARAEGDYDAARSDAAYRAVEDERSRATTASSFAAGALVVTAMFAGARRERRAAGSRPASAARILGATTLDAVGGCALMALAIFAANRIESLALADALGRILPSIVVASWLALAVRGASPGMHAMGLEIPANSPRAPLAIALLPLTAPWVLLAGAPLALAIALRRTPSASLLAPHLAIAGLAVSRADR